MAESMTLDAFRATREPAGPELMEAIREAGAFEEGANFFTYAEGYCLFEKDGGFWPVAWLYAPRRHDTLASAEEDLFNWRAEFV